MDPRLATLAKAPNFAVLTTLLPDGGPPARVMWFDAEVPYDEGSIRTERVALVIEPHHVFELSLQVQLGETASSTEG